MFNRSYSQKVRVESERPSTVAEMRRDGAQRTLKPDITDTQCSIEATHRRQEAYLEILIARG